MSLPLDVWQLIINFNDSLVDVRSIELVCKAFRHLSTKRTSLTFYEQPWTLLTRFTNLRMIKGLISGCCEAIFQSKLVEFMISADIDIKYRDENEKEEDELPYINTNKQIVEWLVKYPKQKVKVYSNVVGMSERSLLYVWTPLSLTVGMSASSFMADLVNIYRSKHQGKVVLRLVKGFASISSVNAKLIKELAVQRLLVGPGFDYKDLFNHTYAKYNLNMEGITVLQHDDAPHGIVVSCPIHVERWDPSELLQYKMTKKGMECFQEMYYSETYILNKMGVGI